MSDALPRPPEVRMFDGPANAYDRFIGRYARPLARELVRRAGVGEGDRVLDVGCGPGALTAELVATVGADHVAAVDPSPRFVDACRRRHPGVRVDVAGAEALPFEDAEMDATFAQLVVNFMTDAHAGGTEMKRVTRPGGMVVAATWDYASGMTLLRTFWDAAVPLDQRAEARDEARSMRYCTAGELRELWSSLGFADIDLSGVSVSTGYASVDDLWLPLEAGLGPAGMYVASLDTGARVALKAELTHRLGVGEEPFELSARAWVVTGRVA